MALTLHETDLSEEFVMEAVKETVLPSKTVSLPGVTLTVMEGGGGGRIVPEPAPPPPQPWIDATAARSTVARKK
jgi:hypothetical protein